MKKFFMTLISIATVSSAMAQPNESQNKEARIAFDTTTQVNVEGSDAIRLLLWVPQGTDGKSTQVEASVESTYASFECQIESISRSSTKPLTHKENGDEFEVMVNWSPGADLSGCVVAVKAEGHGTAYASLYMSY